MKKNIIIFSTLLLTFSSSFGADLSTYRREFYSDKVMEINAEVENRVGEIRELIGTTHLDELDEVLSSDVFKFKNYQGVKKTPQTSGFFKNKLNDAVIDLMRKESFEAPMAFSSEWSLHKFRNEKKKNNAKSVMALLNKGVVVKKDKQELSQLRAFLEAIKSKLIKKTGSKKVQQVVGHENILKMKEQVASYVKSNSPLNEKQKSINSLFGEISRVEVNDGIINEIDFILNDQKISTSLSMFLSLASGEEDHYLAIQEILIDYLNEQNKVFLTRIEHLAESNFEGFVKNIWKSYVLKIGRSNNREDSKSAANSQRHILDRQVAYERTINFLEGVTLSNANSISFLKNRVKLNEEVLVFLNETLKNSKVVSQKLKALSSEQIHFMLDLHLRLRQSDIVTGLEVTGFGEDQDALVMKFGEKMNSTKSKGSFDEINTDYYFYKIMSEQLSRLAKSLKAKNEITLQKQELIYNFN